jgi:uridylate kinase
VAEEAYQRILLKLSGEALLGEEDYGIDPNMILRIAREIAEVNRIGVQTTVVIGGGNIFRGAGLAESGIDRVTGDHMGMLATVMNALALQDALESIGTDARVMSAVSVHDVCEDYIRRRAIRHLEKGRVVVCAGGTGNPFFTTAPPQHCVPLVGATSCSRPPRLTGYSSTRPAPDAVLYPSLSYDRVTNKSSHGANAIVLCRDQGSSSAYSMSEEGNLIVLSRRTHRHPGFLNKAPPGPAQCRCRSVTCFDT